MLGGFAKSGVVVRCGCSPNVGNNRSFGLVHIAAAVVRFEGFVPSRKCAVASNEHGVLLIDDTNHLQSLVGNAFAGSRSSKDETLEVGEVLLSGRAVAEEEIRNARGRGCEHGEEQDVLFFGRLSEREHLL